MNEIFLAFSAKEMTAQIDKKVLYKNVSEDFKSHSKRNGGGEFYRLYSTVTLNW